MAKKKVPQMRLTKVGKKMAREQKTTRKGRVTKKAPGAKATRAALRNAGVKGKAARGLVASARGAAGGG